jgi:hypothetical protein
MRQVAAIAAVACPLAIAACGGGNSSSTSHGMAAVTPQATTTQAVQTTGTHTGPTASQPATTRAKTTPPTAPTSTRATITVGGQVESVAPGTRAACIHKWAPQFPAGQARHAVLSQCKNLPR